MPQTYGRKPTAYEQDLHSENVRTGAIGKGWRGFEPGTGYNKILTESETLLNQLNESLKRDPMEEVESHLPALFEHVNPGFKWADRNNMIPGGRREQHWNQVKQQFLSDFGEQSVNKEKRLTTRLELIGKKLELPWNEQLKRAKEMAEAKREPKEPEETRMQKVKGKTLEKKYTSLTEELDGIQRGDTESMVGVQKYIMNNTDRVKDFRPTTQFPTPESFLTTEYMNQLRRDLIETGKSIEDLSYPSDRGGIATPRQKGSGQIIPLPGKEDQVPAETTVVKKKTSTEGEIKESAKPGRGPDDAIRIIANRMPPGEERNAAIEVFRKKHPDRIKDLSRAIVKTIPKKDRDFTVAEFMSEMVDRGIGNSKQIKRVGKLIEKDLEGGLTIDIESFKKALGVAGIAYNWTDQQLYDVLLNTGNKLGEVGNWMIETVATTKLPGSRIMREK